MTVRVKQLEWLERRRFLEADGYQVCCNGDPYDPDAMYRVKFHGKVVCKQIKGVDRATQWAQTHHERRILSAIEDDRDGASAIAEERRRQVEEEGWTQDHDDTHDAGEMAEAAACYALGLDQDFRDCVPVNWPWSRQWWKPSDPDRRRNLVRAGALIAAEIDRLDRAAIRAMKGGEG